MIGLFARRILIDQTAEIATRIGMKSYKSMDMGEEKMKLHKNALVKSHLIYGALLCLQSRPRISDRISKYVFQ